jgi:hypothetical protein
MVEDIFSLVDEGFFDVIHDKGTFDVVYLNESLDNKDYAKSICHRLNKND